MNVAEWAAFNGDPVGCWFTSSIRVLILVPSSAFERWMQQEPLACGRAEGMVDLEQVRLLGEVVQFILRADQLPPQREQDTIEGLQFFTMHPDLRCILERALEVRLTEAARARSA